MIVVYTGVLFVFMCVQCGLTLINDLIVSSFDDSHCA